MGCNCRFTDQEESFVQLPFKVTTVLVVVTIVLSELVLLVLGVCVWSERDSIYVLQLTHIENLRRQGQHI
jgi:hypothetical protein